MYREELINRRNQLEKLMVKIEKSMSGLPAGNLRIAKRGNTVQLYHVTKKSDTRGTYIRSENRAIAEKLAQRDYAEQMKKEAARELKAINTYLKADQGVHVEDIYSMLKSDRKQLVTPWALSDQEFVEAWQAESYRGKGFSQYDGEYYTNRGERVRSKSEVIIANMLDGMKIPYKYECPLNIDGIGTIYPDFTILIMKERRVKYLEHFGMMEDQKYLGDFLLKVNQYCKCGIIPGRDLIMTFESKNNPLNTSNLMKIIEATT